MSYYYHYLVSLTTVTSVRTIVSKLVSHTITIDALSSSFNGLAAVVALCQTKLNLINIQCYYC